MSYATQADIVALYGEEELIQLADRDRDGAADAGVVEAALSDASEEIDGYLSVQYDLPLDEARTRPLRRIAVDIAMYRMANTAPLNTDERRDRYRDAVRYLDKVSKGTIRLGIADDEPRHPARFKAAGPGRRFTAGRRLM